MHHKCNISYITEVKILNHFLSLTPITANWIKWRNLARLRAHTSPHRSGSLVNVTSSWIPWVVELMETLKKLFGHDLENQARFGMTRKIRFIINFVVKSFTPKNQRKNLFFWRNEREWSKKSKKSLIDIRFGRQIRRFYSIFAFRKSI